VGRRFFCQTFRFLQTFAAVMDDERKTNPLPRLGERGQIFVTAGATESFSSELSRIDGRSWRSEEARRYLTELLIEGRVAREDETPWKVRVRTRSSGLDISANVIREGRLLVVLAAHVRGY